MFTLHLLFIIRRYSSVTDKGSEIKTLTRLAWTWTCAGLDKGGLDYSPELWHKVSATCAVFKLWHRFYFIIKGNKTWDQTVPAPLIRIHMDIDDNRFTHVKALTMKETQSPSLYPSSPSLPLLTSAQTVSAQQHQHQRADLQQLHSSSHLHLLLLQISNVTEQLSHSSSTSSPAPSRFSHFFLFFLSSSLLLSPRWASC